MKYFLPDPETEDTIVVPDYTYIDQDIIIYNEYSRDEFGNLQIKQTATDKDGNKIDVPYIITYEDNDDRLIGIHSENGEVYYLYEKDIFNREKLPEPYNPNDQAIEILRITEEDFKDPRPSPLVLDLDGDGIELTALDGSSAYFDLNINGFAELTGWVSPDDALLALDVNGDGIINDGSELFGDQTGHDHGFLALDVNGINVNRMSARAINLNAVNDNHSPSIKPAA